jgi:hypothetical protein
MMFDYLAVWRAAEVTPENILKAMASNGAELLRISKERGAIVRRPVCGYRCLAW